MKVQTLIGTTYFPIPNVKIEIYKDFNGNSQLFFSGYTGDSGYIDGLVLPCPQRRTDYLNGAAIYKIVASHPNYQDVEIEEVYIYDGIKSIQKIEMVPTSYILGKEGSNGK